MYVTIYYVLLDCMEISLKIAFEELVMYDNRRNCHVFDATRHARALLTLSLACQFPPRVDKGRTRLVILEA